MNRTYKEARQEEDRAESKAEPYYEEIKNCRVALENAEKEAKETLDELEKKKKWRKTVQKRLQLVEKFAAEEDNSDLGTNNYQSTVFV